MGQKMSKDYSESVIRFFGTDTSSRFTSDIKFAKNIP
jgi:hypothetical protein